MKTPGDKFYPQSARGGSLGSQRAEMSTGSPSSTTVAMGERDDHPWGGGLGQRFGRHPLVWRRRALLRAKHDEAVHGACVRRRVGRMHHMDQKAIALSSHNGDVRSMFAQRSPCCPKNSGALCRRRSMYR